MGSSIGWSLSSKYFRGTGVFLKAVSENRGRCVGTFRTEQHPITKSSIFEKEISFEIHMLNHLPQDFKML